MTTALFVLPDHVHMLDVAGPAQVLGAAADCGAEYRLRYFGETATVRSHQGLDFAAETRWPDLHADDVVVVPGWRASGARVPLTRDTLRSIATHHGRGGTIMSVCSGAFALAAAGLLDGRRCTTHHELCADLAAGCPGADVVRDVLYVVDGRVRTSAGIASGIDAALGLLADRHGPAVAAKVARTMVVYTRRNGDSPQSSLMLAYRDHTNDAVHRALDLIDSRFTEPLPLQAIARHAGVSERTLTRAFGAVADTTPLRYQQALRVEHAEALIAGGVTVEGAAHAVGFADARMLRRLRSARP
ncbi:DJ-1/PfpI family protein [Tsukamurella sp. 8F]|uniref:GlxA family transcriptional regulator n=1 Tax=unclassified Tsukamurella TaxID=2633480 RepID=UPI0023B9E457|nr:MULTISPECIES: DJ-1/PfpI family protein [unclassified Tsukamurella]MDF0531480.1 DJ-1/PfpI family protein [Tsukamurella sp. 8J]MDF0588724.1 DJ-1/PfpI family protein [Tsukamurella sp. 8F]